MFVMVYLKLTATAFTLVDFDGAFWNINEFMSQKETDDFV
jgi:hypothetical protein